MILRNITSSEPGDEFDQKRAEGFVFGDLAVGSQLLQEPRGGLRIGFEGRGFWRVDPTSTNGSCMPAPSTATPHAVT